MTPDYVDVLIFEVEGQRHGLPVADVQELLPAMSILPLPGAAPGVEGVINLRGEIVPVLDVRKSLGMPSRPMVLGDHFIVVRNGDRPRALHVDHATELVRLSSSALSQIETQGTSRARSSRVARIKEGMVVVHEISDLLATASEEVLP